jgi:hypothetical protein
MAGTIDERDVAALAEFLDQDDAALFVGSGISLWSGLPSWSALIHALISHAAALSMPVGMAQSALREGRLMDAADALDLSSLEIANVLRQRLGFNTAKPHRIHELLLRLGPRRFITTNYDTLIEQQLGVLGDLGEYRTVTGNRLAEMADMLKASADKFIFKAHGDIGDAATMILSARDYERVMLGGPNLIRQALETLLVSRPILFLGYGLHDPDLNLVLRSLNDAYRGNIHHLFAIVGNLSEEERDYWWRRFRIRAFGYEVRTEENGRQNHDALIDLLDAVAARGGKPTGKTALATIDTGWNKAIGRAAQLTRYAASLIRDEDEGAITLIGRLHGYWGNWPDERVNRLHGWPLQAIIEECPVPLILVGSAGSGKSHALVKYLSDAGTRLLAWQTQGRETDPPPIPVLLDARLYAGSFDNLLRKLVPDALDLASRSAHHRIDIIIDSIDEMPQEQLDSGEWRADLARFSAQFEKCRLIYGSRRPALVGDPAAAPFHIQQLMLIDVKRRLILAGLSPDSFASQLLEDISSPFLLSLILEFGQMVGSARSIANLLAVAIRSYLSRLPADIDRSRVETFLKAVAHQAVIAGRETIAIADFATWAAAGTLTGSSVKEPEKLLEALVRSGLLISEVEAQLRFVHRSVTEYLCSSHILSKISSTGFDLPGMLSNRRWDDPIVWALSNVDADQARSMLPPIYKSDPVLAFRITVYAERNGAAWWDVLLDEMLRDPPSQENMFAIRYVDESEPLSPTATPKLRALTRSTSAEVRGWAWLRYAHLADDKEIIVWLDNVANRNLDYNELQLTAPAIGEQIRGATEEHFKSRLASPQYSHLDDEIMSLIVPEANVGQAYAMVIEGLQQDVFARLLTWSRSQPDMVRAIVCRGLQDVPGDLASRYLVRQLDRGFSPACFPLYLGTKYEVGNQEGRRPVPPFTPRRLEIILVWLRDMDKNHWPLFLLETYLSQSAGWRRGVTERLAALPPKIRRVVQLVSPNGRAADRRRFALSAIDNPARLDELGHAVMKALGEGDIQLPEPEVLSSIERHGLRAISLLYGWIRLHGAKFDISGERMNAWIDTLAPLYPRETWPPEAGASNLFQAIARAWSFDTRSALLGRAEDPADPQRDFILSAFVLRLTGFSIAELSVETAEHMLTMFLDGEIEPYPSLGEAATESFIEDIVLPRAALGMTDYQRGSFEQILYDAGNALGRRFGRVNQDPILVE